MSYLVSFCSCVFQSFSIAISSLGKEKANLSAFHTFVRFVLVWICRFPLPCVWEGLRFVIVHSLDFSLTFFLIRTGGACLYIYPFYLIAIPHQLAQGLLLHMYSFVDFDL